MEFLPLILKFTTPNRLDTKRKASFTRIEMSFLDLNDIENTIQDTISFQFIGLHIHRKAQYI